MFSPTTKLIKHQSLNGSWSRTPACRSWFQNERHQADIFLMFTVRRNNWCSIASLPYCTSYCWHQIRSINLLPVYIGWFALSVLRKRIDRLCLQVSPEHRLVGKKKDIRTCNVTNWRWGQDFWNQVSQILTLRRTDIAFVSIYGTHQLSVLSYLVRLHRLISC
jgi:hypothetical protein